MQKEKFRSWLMNVKRKSKAQISDNLSRVKRVENAFSEWLEIEIDMDKECEKDQCNSLMSYLNMRERSKISSDINLPTTMGGLSTLKSSVKNYVEFYQWDKEKN